MIALLGGRCLAADSLQKQQTERMAMAIGRVVGFRLLQICRCIPAAFWIGTPNAIQLTLDLPVRVEVAVKRFGDKAGAQIRGAGS